MVHGEPYTIFFYDKRIADAINGRNIWRFDNKYFQKLQQLNRLYAGLKTSINPTFTLISNLRRDWLEMTSNNFISHGARHALLSFYNRIRATRFGSVQNAIRKYQSAQLRSINDATSDVERYVVEFFENGGAVNITQLPDYNTAKVDLMSDIETYMRTGKLPENSGVINRVKNKFNNMAERVELAPRIATYIASRTIGRSVNQSVNDAKEATVNFDRKGAWSGIMGMFQLFYNASAQSVRRQIHLAKHHPIRFLTNLAMVALASPIYSLLLSMLLGDADDWEENCARYFSINPELRRRYNIILIGDRYIRLPMAVNYLPYSTLGDVIANAIFNPNKRTNYTQDALDLTSAVLDTFIPSMFAQPIGFSFDWITARNEKERENALRALFGSIATPIAGALFGQFTEPIMQGIGNYNFMGGTLYDTPFNKNSQEPSYIRARQYTQPVWIWASQLLNDATGGNEIKKGLDVPPEAIENMMTILGGWGEYGENLLSIAGAIITKDTNADIYKSVPLFSRLYGGNSTEQYNKYMQSLFYTDISRMEQYSVYRKNATKKGTRADFEREYTPDERRYFADIATLDKVADKIRETIKKDTPEGQHPQYYMDPRMIEIYNTANRQAQSLLTHQSYTPIDDPYYIYMYMRDAIEKNPYLSADGTYTNLSTDEIRQSTINEIKDLWESYSIAKRSMDKIKGYYPGMTLDIYQQQHYNLFVDEITKWKNKYPNIDLYNLLEH
ncbi:MAG: LPD38 domain-containing protein, partial [Bacteroidales bacterium]|nr:LPD38 domain-containing protein [Bacteroidales bacterium]